jgi:ribosome-binding protein aMBF1 (putative translation factor)
MVNLTRRCRVCGSTVNARMITQDTGTEIVTEARYVCPRCTNFVARETIKTEPKKKA